MTKMTRSVSYLVLLLMLLFHAQAHADTLKGVTAVTLTLTIDKTLTDAGVDEASIRNSVEVKIRNTGLVILPVFPKAGEVHAKSCVALLLSGEGLKIGGSSICCYACRAEAIENVLTLRNTPTIVLATTWNTSSFGYFGTNRSDAPKTALDDIADSFCNAYLTANPKPSPVAALPAPTAAPSGNAFTLPASPVTTPAP